MLKVAYIAAFLAISFWGSVEARSLSTAALPSSTKPFEGSKIFQVGESYKGSSAMEFLLNRFVALEKSVRKNNGLSEELLQEQDKEIRQTVSSVLDLKSIGRFAIQNHLEPLSESEEGRTLIESYLGVFIQLVEENYIERARQYLTGDHEIIFETEERKELRNEELIVVAGRIRQPDVDLILKFFVQEANSSFRVVDIQLDETSLRGTYRGSFNRIVNRHVRGADDREEGRRKGMQELIQVMTDRLEELRSGEATRL